MSHGPLKLPRMLRREKDPYWDFFINAPVTDQANLVASSMHTLAEGRVFPVKSELHSPSVTSNQIKELASFLGAHESSILKLQDESLGSDAEALPYVLLCVLRAEYDPREAMGIGGQAPVLAGGFATFLVAAYIRELGYAATRVGTDHGDRLAVAAGLGMFDKRGRLRDPRGGSYLYAADIIRTDLPLAADIEVESPWLPT